MSWVDSTLAVLDKMGYLGAFLAGFLGASIPLFPSFVLIPMMATQLNPLIVGVASGIGAGVGQYLHYYIGLGGRHLLSPENQARFERWRDRHAKYGAWLILLLAATPLTPDDIIWIPLGLMRYPKMKALVAGTVGKTTLCLAYAYAGYYGWPIVDQLLNNWGL